ncbi:MAG: hypothetical protein F4X40_07970 [Chloroflexi bacterium]|nr:hypothetical protein [Chloroflexota bacterium]
MKPEFILNATDVERGLRLNRSDPEDRARLVRLVDLLLDGLETSFERGLERDQVLLWLDTDIGEGSLFRALAMKVPTMLTFQIDVRNYLEAAIEEINEVTELYKPDVLLLRVMNAATDMGQISAPSSASQMARSLSPIDKHISIYDFASTFGIDIGWDIRKPRGEWPDPLVQSENALRTITLFQDAGLDPSIWVMNLPTVKIVAEALSARTHIDDRTDVVACFALESIFWSAFREQNGDLDTVPPSVTNATQAIATMPGNAIAVVGGETYATCLNQYAQSVHTAEDVVSTISSRFLTVSKSLKAEFVPV